MKKFFLLLTVLFLVAGCSEEHKPIATSPLADGDVVQKPMSASPSYKYYGKNCESEGVVFLSSGEINYLENTNSYPLRVRCVTQIKGETTNWIQLLAPSSMFQLPQHSYQNDFIDGFYIYDIQGVLIGWISSGCVE